MGVGGGRGVEMYVDTGMDVRMLFLGWHGDSERDRREGRLTWWSF